MTTAIQGNPIAYSFQCRNQAGALFDPDTVEVSIVKGDGSEELLTYGGTNPRDDLLTRASIGAYAFWITADVVGQWSILTRWTQATSDPACPLTMTPTRRIIVDVTPLSPHTFADRPLT